MRIRKRLSNLPSAPKLPSGGARTQAQDCLLLTTEQQCPSATYLPSQILPLPQGPDHAQPRRATSQFILDPQCFPPAFAVIINFPQDPIAILPIPLTEKPSGPACVGAKPSELPRHLPWTWQKCRWWNLLVRTETKMKTGSGREQAESCEHNSLSSKSSETREFRNLSSPWALGVRWTPDVISHGVGTGQRTTSITTSF